MTPWLPKNPGWVTPKHHLTTTLKYRFRGLTSRNLQKVAYLGQIKRCPDAANYPAPPASSMSA
jgi:hypothetical protein